MCIVLTLLLVFILVYYSDAILTGFALTEQVGEQWVEVAQSWEILAYLWPLALLFLLLGVLITLVFLKFKKVI